MHLVHRDRNYIYNFWPREGESIAQAWGRLKSMLYSCPNHELSKLTITTGISYFAVCHGGRQRHERRTAKGSGKVGYGKQLLCRLLPGG